MAHPNCYIIAGPNGAGKTTSATRFLPHCANRRNFINPDLLARAYSPFDPDAGIRRAGRTALERIAEFTAAGTEFAFETTLAGRSYAPLLRKVRKAGFRLHMFSSGFPAPNWGCCAFVTGSRAAGTTFRSGMFGDASVAHWVIYSGCTGHCSIRCISSTTLLKCRG